MKNLTPHPITLRTGAGDITFPPSGVVARVATVEAVIGSRDVVAPGAPETDEQGNSNGVRIPVVSRSFGDVEGLPEPGTPCLVSALVLSAVPGRAGVYAPDTGETAIRNEKGFVVAVTRLVAA
jgi:hypothetical protein